ARDGKLSEFSITDVMYSSTPIRNAIEGKSRGDSITHVAYADGHLYVAGLSNEEFASKLRSIPFPFASGEKAASVEIFHTSHGRIETASPVRTFVLCEINGEANLLCAYTCTPLVKIPISQLKPGQKVKGTTVAELGNRNRPLDMIVYRKGGKEYILMANSSRGVMKIPTEGVDKIAGLSTPVRSGSAGLKYDTISALKGVEHLDRFDKDHALVLLRGSGGSYELKTIELP
ncbi:MAG: hypothetical protein ACRD36_09775, partial [Candidatus Acidiferrum sp.]